MEKLLDAAEWSLNAVSITAKVSVILFKVAAWTCGVLMILFYIGVANYGS